jgi:hypothetical protein
MACIVIYSITIYIMQLNKALHSSKYRTLNDLHSTINDIDNIIGGSLMHGGAGRKYKSISGTMSKKAENDILKEANRAIREVNKLVKENPYKVKPTKVQLTASGRCPRGYRKDKKTGECVLSNTTPKIANKPASRSRTKLTEEEKLRRREEVLQRRAERKEATRQRKEAEKEAKRIKREEEREAKKEATRIRNNQKAKERREAQKKYKEDAKKKLEEHKAKRAEEKKRQQLEKEEEEKKATQSTAMSKKYDDFKTQLVEFRKNMRMFPEYTDDFYELSPNEKGDLKYYLDKAKHNRDKAKDLYKELTESGYKTNQELSHDIDVYEFIDNKQRYTYYSKKY